MREDIANSRVESGGTIGAVRASRLLNSEILAGIGGDDRFPAAAAAFANEAAIQKVTLKPASRGPDPAPFDNSVIAAKHLGKINLGAVNATNGGMPFGLAADTIAAVAATAPSGQPMRDLAAETNGARRPGHVAGDAGGHRLPVPRLPDSGGVSDLTTALTHLSYSTVEISGPPRAPGRVPARPGFSHRRDSRDAWGRIAVS